MSDAGVVALRTAAKPEPEDTKVRDIGPEAADADKAEDVKDGALKDVAEDDCSKDDDELEKMMKVSKTTMSWEKMMKVSKTKPSKTVMRLTTKFSHYPRPAVYIASTSSIIVESRNGGACHKNNEIKALQHDERSNLCKRKQEADPEHAIENDSMDFSRRMARKTKQPDGHLLECRRMIA
ncbi:hypothetical protein BDV97DRAFT_393546 [Delphinella strobiligena]|nr:hypothetical protein BDV97DRAFT_393546 [Delphinella strobiligena]